MTQDPRLSVERYAGQPDGRVKAIAKRVLPEQTHRTVRRLLVWPPIGTIRFGSLRRLTPISRRYGQERGTPIDRYYIESFISRYAGKETYGVGDIRGRVLEVGDDMYTRKFGAAAVDRSDVLHVGEGRPGVTLVADLTSAGDDLPSNAFDCVLCTQTLHVIYDVRAALGTLQRMLKPGGVLLATVPGISQICKPDRYLWGDYWRFTSLSARRVLEEFFPAENVTVEAYGNVLTATAFLYGVATEELRRRELDPHDPDYEVTLGLRAIKAASR
jgi:SAM-dependent methyltransferase